MSDEELEDKNLTDEPKEAEDIEEKVEENIFEEAVASTEHASHDSHSLDAVYDIPVQVSAVLGHVTMPVSQLLKLGRGAIVELDRHVGEAVDIYVNNRLIARGEVIVMEDRLGVTMTEILKSERF